MLIMNKDIFSVIKNKVDKNFISKLIYGIDHKFTKMTILSPYHNYVTREMFQLQQSLKNIHNE